MTQETIPFLQNEETTKSVPTADNKIELAFARFWTAYPRRRGPNPKSLARAKFMTALRRGSDAEKIIAAAHAYAKELGIKVGTEFVCMASTWLNQRRYEDYEEQETKYSAEEIQAAMQRERQRQIKLGRI